MLSDVQVLFDDNHTDVALQKIIDQRNNLGIFA